MTLYLGTSGSLRVPNILNVLAVERGEFKLSHLLGDLRACGPLEEAGLHTPVHVFLYP